MEMELDKIRPDGGTQLRAVMDTDFIKDLARHLEEDAALEVKKVVVFHDGAEHWLAHGFHRRAAYKLAGRTKIQAEVRKGTLREAILHAAGANSENDSVPRSNADKRKAILTLLADTEWAAKSNRWLATQCQVSEHTVATVRKDKDEEATAQTRTRSNGRPKAKKPEREPGEDESFAEDLRKRPKSGQLLVDWGALDSHLGRLVRLVDTIGSTYPDEKERAPTSIDTKFAEACALMRASVKRKDFQSHYLICHELLNVLGELRASWQKHLTKGHS